MTKPKAGFACVDPRHKETDRSKILSVLTDQRHKKISQLSCFIMVEGGSGGRRFTSVSVCTCLPGVALVLFEWPWLVKNSTKLIS